MIKLADLSGEHKTMAKGTFWGLTGTIILKFVSFVYSVIIARLFTQDDVGTFFLALSIMYIAGIFGDLGLNSAFNRYVPYYIGRGEKDKSHTLLRASYMFSGVLSLSISILLFLSSGLFAGFFNNPALSPTLQFISLYIVLGTFFTLNIAFLQGLKKIKENSILLNAQNILKLALTVVLYFIFGANAFVLSAAFTFSYLILAAASFIYVNRALDETKISRISATLKEQFSMLREIVPFGLTLAIVTTFWSIATYIDRIMMGYLLPQESSMVSIAIYTMAISLATLISIFPGAVLSIFFPIISEMYGGNRKDEFDNVSVSAFRWISFMVIPLTILMIAFPQEILQMFYGASYARGAWVLVIFSIGMFIRSLSYVHGTILAAMRVVKVELYAALSATAINIILNIILIPRFGMNGSAFASAISFTAVTILLVYYCKKIAGFGFSIGFLKPVFAGLISLVLLVLIKGSVFQLVSLLPALPVSTEGMVGLVAGKLIKLAIIGLLFFLACAVFFVSLVLIRGFAQEDRDLISSAMRRAKVPDNIIITVKGIMGEGNV